MTGAIDGTLVADVFIPGQSLPSEKFELSDAVEGKLQFRLCADQGYLERQLGKLSDGDLLQAMRPFGVVAARYAMSLETAAQHLVIGNVCAKMDITVGSVTLPCEVSYRIYH